MYKLYYSPGAVSLASHVMLVESGLPYTTERVSTKTRDNFQDAYKAVNAISLLPALQLPSGDVLTETPAVLLHLARASSSALWPNDADLQERVLERMSFITGLVHPSYALYFRPERWGLSDDAQDAARTAAKARFVRMLQHVEELCLGDFLVGDRSIADLHLLPMLLWAGHNRIPLDDMPKLRALRRSLLALASVQQVLVDEGLVGDDRDIEPAVA